MRFNSRLPLLILILSFSAFYAMIELLLLANRSVFGPENVANTIEILLVSFLNLAPAGIFAFTIVSILPQRLVSKYNDQVLMLQKALQKDPKIAILYTTYNDFMQNYALYNFAEARKRGRDFYILDDSTSIQKRTEVDNFARDYGVVVQRRTNREGYKAGAINHWLKEKSRRYDYIFILDSDSQVSSSSVDYCVELAKRDPKLAVIQSKTMTMTSSPSRLTKSGVTIQHAYMAVVQAAMKNLGTSPFYGHNALLNVRALESIEGLVAESNEDYKTLARLHNKGYESVYASNSLTFEEIPPDYFSSRKRSLRWARDAVGQLGLLKYKLPGAMIFYLVYGWATYMANIALFSFFLLLAYNGFFPVQLQGTSYFAEMAGVISMAVLILWPLLSLRVKDPELTAHKILSSIVWGSLYNGPMMAPLSAQIVKTTITQVYVRAKSLIGGTRSRIIEEFVVTPKVSAKNQRFSSIVSSLKVEFIIGSLPFVVAIITGAVWYLMFSSIQLFMLLSLPVLIFLEGSKRTRNKPRFYSMEMRNAIKGDATPLIGNSPVVFQMDPFAASVTLRVR